MSEKLTCKMSDGTEWEVDDMKSYWPQAMNGPIGRQAWLRPIKREPREFWCVYNHNLQMHEMYKRRENAEICFKAKPLDCDPPFLVREVIE